MSKTILVTGGAGFIGSHLTEKLLSDNYNVLCIDNYDPYYDRSVKERNVCINSSNPNFKLVEGDILDKEFITRVISQNKIEAVVHLAAKAGVRPSIDDPEGYLNVNVNGTLNILQTMKDNNVKKLIFASSSSVYGNNKKVPFSEMDTVDNPISPYAASKKAAELLCHTYHHLYDMDIFCLRLFTVYGQRQRPDLAIHKFTKLIMNDKEIPFYGDGSTSRDYTHVSDIVAGIQSAIDKVKGFEVINLGGSKTISLSELVKLIEKHTGKKAKIKFLPEQPGNVLSTYANTTKAKNLLGYNRSVSIEDGIKDFVCWFMDKK